jgi:Na+/H+-dicarboxylate symporter
MARDDNPSAAAAQDRAFGIPRRWLAAAFWGAALFAFVMAMLPQPPYVPGQPTDKVLHMIAFAVLAALGAAAYPRVRLLTLLLALSAFGVAIEVFQLIPGLNRTSEFADWVADTVAAAAVLGAVHLWRQRRIIAKR